MDDDNMFEDDTSSHSSYDASISDPYYRLLYRHENPVYPRPSPVTEYQIKFVQGGESRGKCM